MKKVQKYLVSLLVCASLAVPCQALAFFGMDVGLGYWRQDPSGSLDYKPTSAVTGNIDLKNDLNLSTENKPFVRVKVELPLVLPNIYFMATPMSFKGSGPLTRTISFGDTSFNLSAPVESEVKLDHYDLALFYPIPLLNTATAGVFNVELGLNARKLDFAGTISQPTLGQTATKSLSITVPMIYGGIQITPIDSLSFEVELRGVAYSGSSYYDYLGRLKFNPVPLVYVAGGYRAESIKIDESDVKADIKFGGPFIEAGLSF